MIVTKENCENFVNKVTNMRSHIGFDNWQKLIEFFESAHGLPFEGVLIEWDSIKSPF